MALGARIRSLENNVLPDNRTGKFAWEANVGARYYLAPRFGLFAEIGYGIAYLNLGLVVKIIDF
ncbi:MAG: hypothetical protein LBH34_04725 [Prevotellaceae bacterium]|nr:hypothetical protein [Prevotellaceae bacterium]